MPKNTDFLATVKARLPKTYKELRQVSACSGVPFRTIIGLRSGQKADPRISTVQKLWDALAGRPPKWKSTPDPGPKYPPSVYARLKRSRVPESERVR